MVTLEYDSSGNDLKFNFAFNLKTDILAKRLEVRHVLGSVCRGCGALGAREARRSPSREAVPRGWRERQARTPPVCASFLSVVTYWLVASTVLLS